VPAIRPFSSLIRLLPKADWDSSQVDPIYPTSSDLHGRGIKKRILAFLPDLSAPKCGSTAVGKHPSEVLLTTIGAGAV
jgi:hypothetical protein